MNLLKKDFEKGLDLHAKSGGKEGPAMEELRHLLEKEVMEHGKAFREELNKLLEFQRAELAENEKKLHEAKESGIRWIILGIVAAVLLGGFLAFIILKNIMADQEKTQKAMTDAMRSMNMVEKSPINTMMATPDGIMTYMNGASLETLKKLQQYLPEKAENFVGKSIDMLHKNPEVQK